MSERIIEIPLSRLVPFKNSPFKVVDDVSMELLTDSIKKYGLITPLIVRQIEGGYEIISGHRRVRACERAGIDHVTALVKELSQDEAVIAFVDANLTREQLLPSEKAFGYKMKLEAVKRQRGMGDQPGHPAKSVELLADLSPDSKTQIQRYIRLTELEEPILELVDQGRIALTPGVELSYLKPEEQRLLIDAMLCYDATPTYSQANRMRKLSQEGQLSKSMINEVMSEVKGNQKESVKIPTEKISRYFRSGATTREMQEVIIHALDEWYRRQQRRRDYER